MRLNFTSKTAVIISLFLSCITSYSQTPFISQLEGLNDGKEAKITMTDGVSGTDYTIQYRLENTTNWTSSTTKIKKSADVSEGTITGLESNKNYCFRLMQKDSVTNTETTSNEACSIILKSTLISDKAVRLEWSKIKNAGLSRMRLYQVEEKGMFMNYVALGNLSDTTFIFDQLECLINYKFNLEMTFANNNDVARRTVVKSFQVSVNTKSVKLQPALTSTGIVSVSGDNKINYSIFSVSAVHKFDIYKSVNGGEMLKVSENSGNAFTDNNVAVGENTYCYAHKYVNECGNESELSARSCQVKLSSKTYGKLTWAPLNIHADTSWLKRGKTEYIVELVNQDGTVLNTPGKTTDTTFSVTLENYPMLEPTNKFRILAIMEGQLYYMGQFMSFPFYSYSNTAILSRILGNESSKTQMTISPNPAEDKVLINSLGAQVRFVELIDIKGRFVHKEEISGDTFNLSEFEKGKYILRLYDANKKLLNTKTIVKW